MAILYWLDSASLWFHTQINRIRYKNDTVEQREVRWEKARADLRTAIDGVKEEFKDSPADKNLHETFQVLEEAYEMTSKENRGK